MRSLLLTLWAVLALAAASVAPAARAEPVRTENVIADLVSARSTVAPGETFYAALRLEVRPGWHTYWRNPGDSGAATTVLIQPPAGWSVGDIVWPTPWPLPFGPMVNYGFEGVTLYPIPITVPSDAQPGPVTLPAEAEWLVCKDICIFEGGALRLSVTVAAAGADDPAWAGPIRETLAAAPKPAGVEARLTKEGARVRLTAAGGPLEGRNLRGPYFFPFDGVAIDHAQPQAPEIGPNGASVLLTPGSSGTLGQGPLAGVLAVEIEEDGAWVRRGFEIEASPGQALTGTVGQSSPAPGAPGKAAFAEAPASPASGLTLPLAILFAFLGGLILNVMPCVFPVLSLKALGLARTHDGDARRHGLIFLAGVMATFLALAGVLIALQAAGAAVGWGFQLQDPLVVGALALLFFAIGLNLLGAFELGGAVQNVGGGLASRGGDAGAFFTGALAVLAATPCTAPFMAGALGFAAAQPPAVSLAVFAALGLGFAAPMVALSFAPGLQKALPKPGPWMEQFKQFLAFPMFATAVWLAWVLAGVGGPEQLLVLLSAAVALSLIVWSLKAMRTAPSRAAVAGLALALVAAVAWASRPSDLVAEPWSPQRVAELRADGAPVFINFTADWCVTCQANEIGALSRPEVARAFAEHGVVYLKADWTRRDEAIAQALSEYGRNGIPLYVFYAAGADRPVLLDGLLTPNQVVSTVAASDRTRVAQR